MYERKNTLNAGHVVLLFFTLCIIIQVLIVEFIYMNSKKVLLFIGLPIAWDIMWILYFISSRKIKDYFDGNNYLRGSIYSGIVGIVKIYLEE